MSLREDYLKALDRLRAGTPRNAELTGKRISVRNVALEAGRSRNNLYLKEYEDVLDTIRCARPRARRREKVKPKDEQMAALRSELAAAKRANADLASENLTLFHRATQAERRVERLRRKIRDNVRAIGDL